MPTSKLFVVEKLVNSILLTLDQHLRRYASEYRGRILVETSEHFADFKLSEA